MSVRERKKYKSKTEPYLCAKMTATSPIAWCMIRERTWLVIIFFPFHPGVLINNASRRRPANPSAQCYWRPVRPNLLLVLFNSPPTTGAHSHSPICFDRKKKRKGSICHLLRLQVKGKRANSGRFRFGVTLFCRLPPTEKTLLCPTYSSFFRDREALSIVEEQVETRLTGSFTYRYLIARFVHANTSMQGVFLFHPVDATVHHSFICIHPPPPCNHYILYCLMNILLVDADYRSFYSHLGTST